MQSTTGGAMTKDYMAQWETRYSGTVYLFGQAPNASLTSQGARLRRGQTALAVADGQGRREKRRLAGGARSRRPVDRRFVRSAGKRAPPCRGTERPVAAGAGRSERMG